MALAMNPGAMEAFTALPEQRKQEVIEQTHQISSRKEMHDYVENLTGTN
jgi:hypothetical protein